MYASTDKDRRGQFVIDPRIVGQTLTAFGFHLLAVTLCIGLPLFAMGQAMDAFLAGQSPRIIAMFDKWQLYAVIGLAAYVIVATATWLLASFWQNQRTAGPIIRMTAFAHEMAAGRFAARITLRERDELQALAQALNGLAEGLAGRDEALLQEISDRVASLGQTADNLGTTSPSGAPREVVALVDSAFAAASPASASTSGAWPHRN